MHVGPQTVLVAVGFSTDWAVGGAVSTAGLVVSGHVHVEAVLVFHVTAAEGAAEAGAAPPQSCNSRL